MDVALPPEDARAAERAHGLRMTKSNDTTAYLRIPADHLDDEAGRSTALQLLEAAWDKAFHGPRWEIGLGPQSKTHGELCDLHFIEKPLSGECPLCE